MLGVIVTFPFLSECAEILDALGCVIDFRVSVPKAGLGLDLYTNSLFEYKWNACRSTSLALINSESICGTYAFCSNDIV